VEAPSGYLLINEEDYKNLIARISELEKELAYYKHPKNSSNSSIPPSKDDNRIKKNQSLREKSDKKVGGQLGHKGSTLQMSETPDHYQKHESCFCNECGRDLSAINPVLTEKRQVIDVEIKRIITQHEIYTKTCLCGNICKGEFPFNVKAPVQYGSQIEALNAYFSVRHYLSFNRISEFFGDVFKIPMSEGTVSNLLKKLHVNASVVYRHIKEQIKKASVIGADETGIKINGEKAWIWCWQNALNTFLVAAESRGSKTIDETFPEGLANAILISDAWAAHLKMLCKKHQLCLAHLLRDINYLTELYPDNDWVVRLKMLLKSAMFLKKDFAESDYSLRCKKLEQELEEILKDPPDIKDKKAKPFYKRLVKNRNSLLTFLYHEDVPPDNNASERSIRNAKPKMKISGQFKTDLGAEIFAVMRSVIDTLIKRKRNVLEALSNMAAWSPA
jgi:transposase